MHTCRERLPSEQAQKEFGLCKVCSSAAYCLKGVISERAQLSGTFDQVWKGQSPSLQESVPCLIPGLPWTCCTLLVYDSTTAQHWTMLMRTSAERQLTAVTHADLRRTVTRDGCQKAQILQTR